MLPAIPQRLNNEEPLPLSDRDQLIAEIASAIVTFPKKQRTALLINLASDEVFDNEPSDLQKAFLAVGINLQEYQHPVLIDPIKRSRHAALLHAAKKRLK